MELLITIAITAFFGTLALSAVAQRTAEPPQIVYIRAEQLDALRAPRGEGGGAIILFCLVVLVAICLL
ncbi:MAG: hypothetical protein WCJ55_07930 [Chloroflexales bacterium]